MVEIGRKLSGRYKILGNIGSGGMANVYLAHDLILDRDVAVKVLRFDFQSDQGAIRRFQREALAATELVHPNIVAVYDVGEEEGMQYLVMEYVKGTDLKKYIAAHSPLSNERIVSIMEQVLSAISLAHSHRIIHRDLKPQNILVDEDNTVKITDFGIAIALSETSITQTNTLLGSVHYLSPEQARGSMATRQSDIYALGIILYELITGKVPFEGESAVSIALKHFQSEVPSVRDFRPTIPQPLENVVLHATAKEASDRYVSADEMLSDISTCLAPERAGEPIFEPSSMLDETKVIPALSDEELATGGDEPAVEVSEAAKEQPEENNNKKKKSKRKIWLIVAAVLAILVGTGTFFAMTAPKTVTIPSVVNLTQEEATEKLEEKGLKVSTKTEKVSSDKVEKDNVVQTDPAKGTPVKEGATITLYISTGAKKVNMPDVKDQTYQEAVNTLTESGIKKTNIRKVEKYSDTVESGNVIKQTPASNKSIAADETIVELTVSKGAKTVSLRSLMYMTKAEVQDYFDQEGLILIDQYTYSDTIAQGSVIAQDPVARTQVKKGDSITVVFSSGPEPKPSTTETSQSTTESTTSPSTTTTSATTTSSTANSSETTTTSTGPH
ncbi:Stk1 family PASTA domain-containing Ser/Thr kinase [Vagococcus entomophilus]|uniref:non-specific serine/threonine protein kinase n=1 Tax=Vagococcus entomophilus TaxID=1160095 RepID=A0A430AFS2_9ENTE|nr:Stk1 family PASTA domain-containing Ser/Thr kinase [Vagococcus entomophilus]RSU06587.1 hypothetical protein CBF30_10100 [Vagococcus entomophilus]